MSSACWATLATELVMSSTGDFCMTAPQSRSILLSMESPKRWSNVGAGELAPVAVLPPPAGGAAWAAFILMMSK
eukprot:scaffold41314_cov146-Skeletonema_marinoi.AAC.1